VCCLRLANRPSTDEAIGHVFSSLLWYLLLPDEDDDVCAIVATWHALGKVTNLVSIGMGLLGLCLGVGNELFVF
jgi:hypothetical protein